MGSISSLARRIGLLQDLVRNDLGKPEQDGIMTRGVPRNAEYMALAKLSKPSWVLVRSH